MGRLYFAMEVEFFLGSTNLGLGDCVAGRMVLFSELPVSAGVGVGARIGASVGRWLRRMIR